MRVVRRKSCSHIMLLVVSSGKRLKNRFLTAKLLPPTESTSVRPQVLQAFLLHLAALTLCYKGMSYIKRLVTSDNDSITTSTSAKFVVNCFHSLTIP